MENLNIKSLKIDYFLKLFNSNEQIRPVEIHENNNSFIKSGEIYNARLKRITVYDKQYPFIKMSIKEVTTEIVDNDINVKVEFIPLEDPFYSPSSTSKTKKIFQNGFFNKNLKNKNESK